jgi:hypothetical protein
MTQLHSTFIFGLLAQTVRAGYSKDLIFINTSIGGNFMLVCKFCNKICKNLNSQRNHERLCKENPNRQIQKPKSEVWKKAMKNKKGANQYTKALNLKLPKPQISDETRKKLSESSKKQIWSEDRRKIHSDIMKKVVEKNPDSYSSSNRGRTKQIIFDGIKFQGKWELEFYQYCKKNNIQIERSNEWFEYEWNGTRKYFPDFYLKQYELYVEVKGYETERDRAKWNFFPKKLKIIKKQDILLIRKGLWDCNITVV